MATLNKSFKTKPVITITHMATLTKSFKEFKQRVEEHVKLDKVKQGVYWNTKDKQGCFIGCLNGSSTPYHASRMYGIPEELQRIAESIFEALPIDEAIKFFAEFPDAVACDHKDLSKVHWKFLAGELKLLSPLPYYYQHIIDLLIRFFLDFADGKDVDIDVLGGIEGDIEDFLLEMRRRCNLNDFDKKNHRNTLNAALRAVDSLYLISKGLEYDENWCRDLTDDIASNIIESQICLEDDLFFFKYNQYPFKLRKAIIDTRLEQKQRLLDLIKGAPVLF